MTRSAVGIGVFLALGISGASPFCPPSIVSVLQGISLLIIPLCYALEHSRQIRGALRVENSQVTRIIFYLLFLGAATVSALGARQVLISALNVIGFALLLINSVMVWNSLGATLGRYLNWYASASIIPIFAYWFINGHTGERFGALVHPNYWGLLCFGSICCSQFDQRLVTRALTQVSAFVVIIDAQSRGALVASIVALSAYWISNIDWRVKPSLSRRSILPFLFGTITIIAGVTNSYFHSFFSALLLLDDPDRGLSSGLSGRDDLIKSGLSIFERYPWFGVGPRMEEFYILGIDGISYTHSGYLMSFVELGTIGSLFLLLFVISGYWQMIRQLKPRSDFCSAGFGLLVGYAAYAVFEPRFLNIGNPVSMLWAMILVYPGKRLD